MRPALLMALAMALPACADGDRAARCAELNDALAVCFPDDFAATDCRDVSDVDIDNLVAILDSDACEAVRDALPSDGDMRAARCRLFDDDCAEPLTPPPVYRPTRYPIVLVNGIDTSPLFRWSDRIVTVMRRLGGHDVHLAIDTPYETPAPIRSMTSVPSRAVASRESSTRSRGGGTSSIS